MNQTSFAQSKYLTQIARLRAVALTALERYPFRVKNLELVHHGENTTFKVSSSQRRSFLLRIHRPGYHSLPAINEELSWLDDLSRETDLLIPKPVLSSAGSLVETVDIASLDGARHVDLFAWREGRFVYERTQPRHMQELGRLMAELHLHTRGRTVKHRRYWTPEGLCGKPTKFGDADYISCLKPHEQKILTRSRKAVLRRLKEFETRFPKRRGLIHADIHFGNFFIAGKKRNSGREHLALIDFDDCGFGFHAHDLAVPLLSLSRLARLKKIKSVEPLKEALLRGYTEKMNWDAADEHALDDLMNARRIVMSAWLNSRADNPRIKAQTRKILVETIKQLDR